MNKIRETPARLDSLTVSSEEFIAVADDNVCTEPQLRKKKTFWSLFKAQKILMQIPTMKKNNAAFAFTSSEMRNIMKKRDDGFPILSTQTSSIVTVGLDLYPTDIWSNSLNKGFTPSNIA
ncbi:hypothetical protein TNCV_2696091 [Trichonephila clavipes]|nr:hypothetical protein TNCV_2696091 [Trichonephila clavipes]